MFGREHELARLEELTATDGPSIVYLHGPYGIGKTALLSAFEISMAARGIGVAKVRGGSFEPRAGAFIAAVGAALKGECGSQADLARALAAQGTPFVLLVDDADELRLIATWLRREFTPSLPVNVRLLIAGRSPPPAAWAVEFGHLYRAIGLGTLARDAVIAEALVAGFEPAVADRLWSMSAGHPLTLRLAVQSARNGSLNKIAAAGEIVSAILADRDDGELVRMTEAASIVRRATRPLLTAMLGADAMRSFATFGELPFVQLDHEGHHLAEPVAQSLAARLASVEPDRHARLRGAAATWISGRLREAGPGERWRYMADLLYLVEQSQVRDAFFPPNVATPPVEPAERRDFPAILEIVGEMASARERAIVEVWARVLPHRFNVARAADGRVLAFYLYARGDDRLGEIAAADSLISGWRDHHRRDGKGGQVIFLRQLLAANGQDDAPERAACLLDLKRAYFERWDLSRVYTAASKRAIESPVYRRLGFRPLSEPADGLPGSMVLELPATGLVGWISTLVGVESPAASNSMLNFARDRREVTIGDAVYQLTRLEAEVLAMLIDRSPAVVTREDMISAIWKRVHVGSNVVDTVIRSLRKKLGQAGPRIATVPKSGYRLVARD